MARKRTPKPPSTAVRQLARFYDRNGYLRWQNPDRLEAEGSSTYKKGAEVRLVANSKQELATIRRLLKAEGFQLGRAFVKGRQLRQPVYGLEQVVRFLRLIDDL